MTQIFKSGLNSKDERCLETLKWLDCRAWVVWAKWKETSTSLTPGMRCLQLLRPSQALCATPPLLDPSSTHFVHLNSVHPSAGFQNRIEWSVVGTVSCEAAYETAYTCILAQNFFSLKLQLFSLKFHVFFLPGSVLLTFGSLNIAYPRCIMFTQPFWKTILRLPKPPSHQIRPASRQIIPIPLHQNALKETYSLLWNVSLFFLLVCGFPIQTWQKLIENRIQPTGC